ncbi:TatD family hydrolase [Candidatus Woesebacteria bacterium]|nr:TatD family hydrolase [Candidatus Woesebacteria bacterium]
MLIDTHAHLWWDSYKDDVEAVIERAKAAGVEKMVVPGTNIESSLRAIELAKKYPGIIYPAVGIHPEDVEGASIEQVTQLISDNKDLVVAIGEIGIDLYTEKEKSTLEAQKVLFRGQCELAIELGLSVIIHTRDSFTETWEVLSSLPTMPRGQFHCFSVDEEALQKVVVAGFYVSFCGNIMYSKRVAKLVPLVPDERLLLETDSPFMRVGERNEPAYVKTLAEKIAELRGQTTEKIEEMTTSNANRLYKL